MNLLNIKQRWLSVVSEYLNKKKTISNHYKIMLLSSFCNIIPSIKFSIEENHYYTVKHLLSAGFELTNISLFDFDKIIMNKKIYKLLLRNNLKINYLVYEDTFYVDHLDLNQKYCIYSIVKYISSLHKKWKPYDIERSDQYRKQLNYARKYQQKYKYLYLCKFISQKN